MTISRIKNVIIVAGALTLAFAINVYAQATHTIIGELKIDTSKTQEKVPNQFFVILSVSFRVIGRQPVSNGGQFRFNNVANGEYDLTVELEGQEVARKRIVLQSVFRTDFRHDLELEWRDTMPNRNKAGVVSAIYPRSSAQQSRFDQALATKDSGKAIEILRQLLKADPKDFVAWTELGTLYFKADNLADSVSAYERAITEKPDYFLALFNLGKLQVARKDYVNAVTALERALAVKSDSAPVNYYLGEAHLGLKKGSKAVAYLNEALRLDPKGMAEAHLRLAALYNAAGYKERAAAEYEHFLAKRPDYPEKEKLQQYITENKKP